MDRAGFACCLFLAFFCAGAGAQDAGAKGGGNPVPVSPLRLKTAEAAKPLPRWIDLDNVTRHLIAGAWLQQDEMLRAPFPVFRDQWLRSNALKQPRVGARDK